MTNELKTCNTALTRNPRPSVFSDGIRFTCVDCGQCCTGAPGLVRMNEEEVDALVRFLDVQREQAKEDYLLPYDDAWRIKEQPNGDCLFFNQRCTIYPVRPSQCRTYPFWFKNMRSEDAWRKTAAACPGIGQGRLYSEEEILGILHEEMEHDQR